MKKKPVGKNDLLEADLEIAKGLLSTADGCKMLGLEHLPENYKASNMYLSALREILRLRDELSNQNNVSHNDIYRTHDAANKPYRK